MKARSVPVKRRVATSIAARRTIRTAMGQRLAAGSHEALSDVTHRLALLGRALHSVSPLATLDRGYAIVKDAQGKVLTEAAGTKSGDEIRAQLSKGELVANVTKVVEE